MQRTNSRLCLIEDDEIMGESLVDRFELEGFTCDWHQTATKARAALSDKDYALVISDITLPDLGGDQLFMQLLAEHISIPPFIFITGHGDIDTAVNLLKQGAHDFITKPFDLDALVDRIHGIVMPSKSLVESIFGTSPAIRQITNMLPRLVGSNASVLVTGESGVGKERVAKTLHELASPEQPFIAVNCGAFSESLLEAELFGYEKGAFTGAARTKKGVFEQADGGTLFLDEIGDMPPSMQVKLLRALQERSIIRVGGEGAISVHLRIVCATHRNLKEMVLAGEFREDLYYRINVVELRVPPLRERREDIITLSKRFLAEFAREGEMPQVLSPAVEQALKEYPWPGNIRELKNTLERATLLSDGRIIAAENLFPDSEPKTMSRSLRDYLAESERDFILRALEAADWKIQTCADAIGISRKNLWEKMRKLEIEKDERLD